MKRVVVTGIGAVTPLGNTFDESLQGLMKGLSGISLLDRFDASDMPYKYAGQVHGQLASSRLTSKDKIRYDLFIQYAYTAAQEAIEDAQLPSFMDDSRNNGVSVVIGSSRAGISSIDDALRKQCVEDQRHALSKKRISPFLMPSSSTSMAASFIAEKYGFTGEGIGISNVCASGVVAIGTALRLIRHGISDIVVAGGSDAPLARICLSGYGASGVLSKIHAADASRPFDISRDGFVLSEGGCVLILESIESAQRRGVAAYAEIIGYSGCVDAFHQTKPDIDGEARTIEKALKDAQIARGEIDFISAHATSTRIGDRAEALALKRVFGQRAGHIPVSAFKSATGHMLAASGAFEAAVSCLVLKDGIIPPTINLRNKDPQCDLTVNTVKKLANIHHALVNSFGFGGVNAVLVIKRVG